MESDKQHFRHILLFYYRKGKNAVQARKKLTDVYGEGVLTVRQCQNWSAKFRSGNFDVEDAPRSGRPVEADKDAIKAFVDANRRITTREIGLSSMYGFPMREICVAALIVCDSLLKRHENDPFLKRIITGDEKGHGAKKDKPAQTISKADIHQKKVMLSVWWNFKGIVFFELLPDNTTINSEVYCHQLDKLNDALQQKRPELINRKGAVFHQDNARPHTSLVTRQKL
ncbi:histone-lysine N-methyltransferase SETMAR [Trichonephila clavipes]|nr:histone-lysine N-methyltransferase SETMAR [Trichonephila clavipes]